MIKYTIDDDIDISSLQVITSCGSVLPPEIHSRLKRFLPNVLVLQAYGMTEACGVVLVFDLAKPEEREFLKMKPNSCGTPIPGVWYKVRNITP